jgi:hypothetical protein
VEPCLVRHDGRGRCHLLQGVAGGSVIRPTLRCTPVSAQHAAQEHGQGYSDQLMGRTWRNTPLVFGRDKQGPDTISAARALVIGRLIGHGS